MSRRKQPHPLHLDPRDDQLNVLLEHGSCNETEEEDGGIGDEHVCGKCRLEFVNLSDFLQHKRTCTKKRLVLVGGEDSCDELDDGDDLDDEHPMDYKDETEKYSEGDLPYLMSLSRVKSFFPDSPSKQRCDEQPMDLESCKAELYSNESESEGKKSPEPPFLAVSDTNVTLQALQNTRVAVAQQLSPLALHTALYTLQQQQILQLHQVIQQLQSQLQAPLGSAALTPPQSADAAAAAGDAPPRSEASSPPPPPLPPPPPPPPPPHEPNTLELLQRHTEQALQNTMAGSSFLLNGLGGGCGGGGAGDMLRFKKGDGSKKEGEEAFFRHRCRFCGKVFGSDSALQIHIRSHTGERPFKCNVCGNRFSTKGNLKVHFGRHKEKYPHIKMNPHPVPLHLDNLHPPIEPPEASETPPVLTQSSPCQSVALSLHPPSLVAAQPLPLVVTHCHDNSSPRHSPPPMDNNHPPPSSPADMSDDSNGGSVDTTDGIKDTDPARYEEDMDDDSFSVSPKTEQKDEDEKPPAASSENRHTAVTSIPSYVSSSAPTFPYFFHPTLSPPSSMASICYPPMSTPPLTTPSSQRTTTAANNEGTEPVGPSPDPNFYQDLLPKPGSNDNSWESLMEVTKTSETSKLQQLVDNIEHKLSDPNQCLFCHRVLSCKSALQMHYRTHTGERPFKCKICSRAFTTKGNLKTHMGVHRSKSSLQVLHQCPVCHKQFTNSLVLQQHIRMHTGEPTDMHPEQIMANEVRQGHLLSTSFPRPVMPSLLPPFTSPRASPAGGGPPNLTPKSTSPPPIAESVIKTASKPADTNSMEDSNSPAPNNSRPPSAKQERSASPQPPLLSSPPQTTSASTSPRGAPSPNMDKPLMTTTPYSPTHTTSLVALENHVKAINTTIPQALPFSSFGLAMGSFFRYDDPYMAPRNYARDGRKSPVPPQSYSPSPNTSRAGSDASADERSTPGSMIKSESPISMNGGQMRLSSGVISAKMEGGALDLTPKTTSMVSVPPPDLQLFPSPLAGLPFPTTPGRLSTTCRICFKTFACNSALEIHYRSHTKERPFKCSVCDRGFTTKGNMKQHLLTHKSRDLQPLLFASTDNSVPDSETNSSTNVASPRTSSPYETNLGSQEPPDKKEGAPPAATALVTAITSSSTPAAKAEGDSKQQQRHEPTSGGKQQRLPKHFCHTCQKPFSSASALQIHNRTHSGEKPFKCVVCGRAFTTKGNLKVHMNTHMAQNNGNSRRGRRMSLEFQPPPKPDLYFPYLPAGYMNGLPPKMNEISVIQSAGGPVVSMLTPAPFAPRKREGSPAEAESLKPSPSPPPEGADWTWRAKADMHLPAKNLAS